MERERKVLADCINASNPFHVCAEYCVQRSPGAKLRMKGGKPAQNGERSTGEVIKFGERRNVDPLCVNSSNPFHQCAEYCSPRPPEANRRSLGDKLVEHKERVICGENRKVDPRCPNASNPFHQCAEYCSQRINEMGLPDGRKSDGIRGGVKVVMERKDVHPQCVNASNPFHKCAEYCFQRINEVM